MHIRMKKTESFKTPSQLFLIMVLCLTKPSVGKKIQCKSDCYHKSDHIVLNDGRRLHCTVHFDPDRKILASVTRDLASRPNDTRWVATRSTFNTKEAMWYVHSQRYIALNISWRHKESYISEGKVKGFYLTIEKPPHGYPARYSVLFNLTKDQSEKSTKIQYIEFQFLCHGLKRNKQEDTIEQTESRLVVLESLPMATMKDEDSAIEHEVKIPDCKDRNGRALAQVKRYTDCKTFWSRIDEYLATSTTDISPETVIIRIKQESWQIITLMSVSLILTLALLALIMAFIRKKVQRDGGYSKLLAIMDMKEDHNLREKCHSEMEHLKEDLSYSLESNWTSREAINNMGALAWFREAIASADVIIFISPNNDLDTSTKNRETSSSSSIDNDNELQIFWNHWSISPESTKKKCIGLQKTVADRNIEKNYPNMKMFQFNEEFRGNDDLYNYLRRLRKRKNKNNSTSTAREDTETNGDLRTNTMKEVTYHQISQDDSQ